MSRVDKQIHRSVLEPTARVHSNYDQIIFWQPVGDGNLPNIAQSEGQSMVISDIAGYSNRQAAIIQTFMNFYQEFRVSGIKATWIPKYDSANAVLTQINQAPEWAGQAGAKYVDASTQSETNAMKAFFGETSEMVMVEDTNDTFTTQNYLEEYYLIRALPGAKATSTRERNSVAFNPHMFDMMAGEFNSSTNPQPGGQLGPAVNAATPLGAGNQLIDTSNTVPNPWRATKVDRVAGQGGPNLVLNTRERMWGFKYYFYTPFATALSTPGAAYEVGMMRFEWELEFRMPDSRNAIGFASFVQEDEVSAEDIKILRKLKGERYLLMPHTTVPTLVNTHKEREKKRVIASGETPGKDETDLPLLHDELNALKKSKTSHPSPSPSSQQTPATHQHRTPLGLPGLKRT